MWGGQQQSEKVNCSKTCSSQNTNADFFPQNKKKIANIDFTHCHCTDNHCAALGTCISAGISEHRNKGNQHWNCCKCTFITCKNRSGNHSGNHQCHQPENSALCQRKYASFQIAGFCNLIFAFTDFFCFFRSHQAGYRKTEMFVLHCQPTGCFHWFHFAQTVADGLIIFILNQESHLFFAQIHFVCFSKICCQNHVFHHVQRLLTVIF